MTHFVEWLDTFISEKNIDTETTFEVEGASGTNFMSYDVVIAYMKIAPAHEQEKIKAILIKIDFRNGDVCHFLRHLAQAIAK